MRHVLVPTDLSETARAALEYAVDLCRDLQGRITLLHVIHAQKVSETLVGLDAIGYLSDTLDLPSDPSRPTPSFNVDDLKIIARQKLEESVDASWRERVSIETAVEEGRPSLKIVEYARQHDVDMIVMGTHGRGPVAHFFLGSVAENIVRSANCPVITVRSKPGTCSGAANP